MLCSIKTAAAVATTAEGTVGLAFTMLSPTVDAVSFVTAQPVVLTGRGQTAPAQTITQTGISISQQVAKSTLCLNAVPFGMDFQAVNVSSSYAKHVSFTSYFVGDRI